MEYAVGERLFANWIGDRGRMWRLKQNQLWISDERTSNFMVRKHETLAHQFSEFDNAQCVFCVESSRHNEWAMQSNCPSASVVHYIASPRYDQRPGAIVYTFLDGQCVHTERTTLYFMNKTWICRELRIDLSVVVYPSHRISSHWMDRSTHGQRAHICSFIAPACSDSQKSWCGPATNMHTIFDATMRWIWYYILDKMARHQLLRTVANAIGRCFVRAKYLLFRNATQTNITNECENDG